VLSGAYFAVRKENHLFFVFGVASLAFGVIVVSVALLEVALPSLKRKFKSRKTKKE
jgi:hypothetical protein